MSDCEIVDSLACGVIFQYCRTHKVEPKDCPGAAVADPYNLISAFRAFKDIYDESTTTSPKREFKVGDKVRKRGGGRVKVVVQGDANVVGLTREKFESLYGVAVLCDDGFFHCQWEIEHV